MRLWHWVALIPHGARTEQPRPSKRHVENMGGYYDSEATMANFFARFAPNSKWAVPPDGTPLWAYDEDHYCVCCGNGMWKHHTLDCELRDALDSAKGIRVKDGARKGEIDEYTVFGLWLREGERQGWIEMSER